jgi:hypothetical protein
MLIATPLKLRGTLTDLCCILLIYAAPFLSYTLHPPDLKYVGFDAIQTLRHLKMKGLKAQQWLYHHKMKRYRESQSLHWFKMRGLEAT